MKIRFPNLKLAFMTLPAIFLLESCHLVDHYGDILDKDKPGNNETVFTVTIENVFTPYPYFQSGVFNTPEGADMPGPLFPGNSYSFEFYAGKGHYLSFATMFVQSNDLFYAPDEMGIPLFKDGEPLEGDITMYVDLWDAGTEVDEKPGEGMYQAPRQSGPDMGMDENGVVRLESEDDDFDYPADEDVIKVYIEYKGDNLFKVSIMNVSDDHTLAIEGGSVAVPLSPGVFVVHTAPAPLFTAGEPDRGYGLEAIAEDGMAMYLGDFLKERTGYVSPIAPGVYLTYQGSQKLLFKNRMADFGYGLEALAEDADPAELIANLEDMDQVLHAAVFNMPVGKNTPGPIFPGDKYKFEITAKPGQSFNFATMLGQTNDLFFGPADKGIALFDQGEPISGDITMYIELWDAGTEVNEFPGAGNYQAPRQDLPDMGMVEDGIVRVVDDGYTYPEISDMIRVTIWPQAD